MGINVNLLDCTQEPSDEQLNELMRSVADEARAKANKTNKALQHTIAVQIAEALKYHQLPNQHITIQENP